MTARKVTAPARTRARSSSTARGRRHDSPPDTVTWVYGVLAGVVADAVLARLPRLPDAGPPYAIALGGALSIVVAQVPRAPFEAGTLETALLNIDWVGRYASAHHTVIARLGQRATILPMRIFTVFDSDNRAKRALGRNRKRLTMLAGLVGERSEWVLRVHRPTPPAPRSTPRTARTSGTAFLEARARAKREQIGRTQTIRAGVSALVAELVVLADDAMERPVEPGTSALAEVAFLIDRGDVASFKRALTKSSTGLRREGCRVALTGPWPAYSFVDLSEAPRG